MLAARVAPARSGAIDRVVLGAIFGVSLAACSNPTATFSHEPIPLELAGAGGGLVGLGTAAERGTLFPMLVDTGSPLTSYSDGVSAARATRGDLNLYSTESVSDPPVRLSLADIQLFVSALGGSGLDSASPVGGVLGGDNLHRFVLGLSYTPAPAITLTDTLALEECELSQRCASVLPFSIAGGRQLIDIGEDIYGYPASYVLLDACVEPALDPLETGLSCVDPGCLVACPPGTPDREGCIGRCGGRRGCDLLCTDETSDVCAQCRNDGSRYLPHGIDVRFAVSTGFPGLALTASAFDRLRGRGSAAALLAAAPHVLYLPDQSEGTAGLMVGVDQLGVIATGPHDPNGRSALALVGVRGYFGACGELARSRRLRRAPPELTDIATANGEKSCLRSADNNPADGAFQACSASQTSGVCDDGSGDSRTNAYVEIRDQVQVIVVPDTTSLLQNINADVRPQSATVEGIIGTELLRRLGATIDYPGGRFVATCADGSCRAFPAANHGTDCGSPFGNTTLDGKPVQIVGATAGGIPGTGCRVP